ncbi:MAG: PmoA family protein [Pirellulales bacterium]|nr:PmoA family protein [Pirellulales bacterium]
MSRRLLLSLCCLVGLLSFQTAAWAEVTAEKSEDGKKVVIELEGKPFCEYLTRSGTKPIIWPILGPTGKPMTRRWPMEKKGPGEKTDHRHHRSLWFTHGDVNGVDFWLEKPGVTGKIVHRRFVKVAGGDEAVVATQNDWIGPDGKKVCEDERTLTFGGNDDQRWIDFDITFKATDGPVRFGDTKEGAMGIRMAASIKPDAKKGGRLVDSEGRKGKAVWGKKAAWVDYSGPVDGQTVGITMMNHPTSFRFPTYWHARTYGLCSANPFGLSDFVGKEADGSYTIPKGKTMALRYRILFHKGTASEAKVADAYKVYSERAK